MEFQKRYKALNEAQKLAVDTLDGPVMIVAGPGTGKTELLSVRVANILQKTDALPGNILCLTFTESGATAMRERLIGLIGPEAHKVAIHTFHSFGSDIINQNGEYFYNGAHFRPADELSSYEILSSIMERLPHSSPLASTMNGQFTYLRDIQTSISELKKSGLTPDELVKILDHNDAFISWSQSLFANVFAEKLSKKILPRIAKLSDDLKMYSEPPLELIGYLPLSELVIGSLEDAVNEAVMEDSTKPITAWKKEYLEKDGEGTQVLKDAKRSVKLRALSGVYYDYLIAMQEHELYDYDDMILRVVHAMEVFNDLRLNLQETYHYILVDEFQDTNDAQMRLVWNLTNNPVSEGRPNLMVVGDDDQAIYRFQGALLSNIIDFTKRYQDVKVITLTDNYRSAPDVLKLARDVIVQGTERLENMLETVNKTLTPHHMPASSELAAHRYETTREAYYSLAALIEKNHRENSKFSRAVIARNHRQLVGFLPYLQHTGLPMRYERQEDMLESEPIRQLELVVRVVHAIATQQFDEANEALSELLAHQAWNIPPTELWQLSLRAWRDKKFWLESMLDSNEDLKNIAEWLIVASNLSKTEPLEYMLDHLFGVVDNQASETSSDESKPFGSSMKNSFSSPLRQYFFNEQKRAIQPAVYLEHLAALQKIRSALREYRPQKTLHLEDFVEFINLHHELDLPVQGSGEIDTGEQAVQLLTAHKAKGLEFDEVYIIDAEENIWGHGARTKSRIIKFSSNLPLSPSGDSDDERLRLLYVALTRAKSRLILVGARSSDNGKEMLPVGAIGEQMLSWLHHEPLDIHELTQSLRIDWRAPLFTVTSTDQKRLLMPRLEHYKLSATHLNNFLDISRGGPTLFLLHNLLRFPQAISPHAAYGSAIHAALQHAHQHFAAHKKKRPVEDILHDFEKNLHEHQLSELDYVKFLEQGTEVLTHYLAERYDTFTLSQNVEHNFGSEHVVLNGAVITGAIDLMEIDKKAKTIVVTDYKTGSPVGNWKGTTDYEKIKLHHYRQQLLFYKLLIEHSRSFAGYTVTKGILQFVEPDKSGHIISLELEYDQSELDEFTHLIGAVWKRIVDLDFSVADDYELNLKGIHSFEQFLLNHS